MNEGSTNQWMCAAIAKVERVVLQMQAENPDCPLALAMDWNDTRDGGPIALGTLRRGEELFGISVYWCPSDVTGIADRPVELLITCRFDEPLVGSEIPNILELMMALNPGTFLFVDKSSLSFGQLAAHLYVDILTPGYVWSLLDELEYRRNQLVEMVAQQIADERGDEEGLSP